MRKKRPTARAADLDRNIASLYAQAQAELATAQELFEHHAQGNGYVAALHLHGQRLLEASAWQRLAWQVSQDGGRPDPVGALTQRRHSYGAQVLHLADLDEAGAVALATQIRIRALGRMMNTIMFLLYPQE